MNLASSGERWPVWYKTENKHPQSNSEVRLTGGVESIVKISVSTNAGWRITRKVQ